jgi:hypothetical protein
MIPQRNGSDEPLDQHGARAEDVLSLPAKIEWLMILWPRPAFYLELRNEFALFEKEQSEWPIDKRKKKMEE